MMKQGRQANALRVLMSVDAVGGVWRYALDLAACLRSKGFETVFAVFGPKPSPDKIREANEIGDLIWCDQPLDWMVDDEAALAGVSQTLSKLCATTNADMLHLNLPSQAVGLDVNVPTVVASHSCVSTWFRVVRHCDLPQAWRWQERLNREGFERADAILVPSQSHATLLRSVYAKIDDLHVIYNASRALPEETPKKEFVFAAGRWWDDGKNGAVLDAAAAEISWPVVMAGSNHGPNGQYLQIKNAQHRGEMPHADTMALMSTAGVVVSPSLYEPFGLAALEAARCGSALVLADIPTYRELWDEAALFADPGDPHAFATAACRFIKDPSLRSVFANRARERSLAYSKDAQAEAVARLYSSLLSATPSLTAAE